MQATFVPAGLTFAGAMEWRNRGDITHMHTVLDLQLAPRLGPRLTGFVI